MLETTYLKCDVLNTSNIQNADMVKMSALEDNEDIPIIMRKTKTNFILSDDEENAENVEPTADLDKKIEENGKITIFSDMILTKANSNQTLDSTSDQNDTLTIDDSVLSTSPIESDSLPSTTQDENDRPSSRTKMTGREAEQLKRQIRSDSQRRVRESSVSLPYHRPKSYNLKEFLEKRSRLPALPKLYKTKAPTPIGINKLADKERDMVSRKLEARIKKVEAIYQSDEETVSDHDEDDIRACLNDILAKICHFSTPPTVLPMVPPKLHGTPDCIIDLESNVCGPSPIVQLMRRCYDAMSKQRRPNDSSSRVNVNVTRIGSDTDHQIHKESLTAVLQPNTDDLCSKGAHQVPGRKLCKLREQLVEKMAAKRAAIWQEKLQQQQQTKIEQQEDFDENNDAFLDDEDEEEDFIEEEEEEEEEEFSEEEKPRKKCDFLDEEAEESDEDQDSQMPQSPVRKKSILKRIIRKPVDDDDSDEECLTECHHGSSNDRLPTSTIDISNGIDKSKLSTENVHNSNDKPSIEEHCLKPKFIPVDNNLTKEDEKNTNFRFLMTDVINMTANSSSTDKVEPGFVPNRTQNKLNNTDNDDLRNVQVEESQNANFCFATMTLDQPQLSSQRFIDIDEENAHLEPSTQDLIAVCSGQFPNSCITQSQHTIPAANSQLIQSDQIISQLLLDDEELQEFRRKFDIDNNPDQSSTLIGGTICSSSDSEGEEDERVGVVRRNKRIVSSEEEESDEEKENTQITYDSEENEVAVTDFLEKEAELSDESQWEDSGDEDEHNLDELEVEGGDEEVFDEREVRNNLERIHMRRLLDDDNREVKLLQELLLEDGELHGAGRKRQFRWRNIDSVDVDGDRSDNFEDVNNLDEGEEESEEQWRRNRHERELFLEKSQPDDSQSVVEGTDLGNCQFVTCNSSLSGTQQDSIEKQPFFSTILNGARGSFLTRSDDVLQKLAQFSKSVVAQNENSNSNSGNCGVLMRNSRNFLFKTVSSSSTSESNDFEIASIGNKEMAGGRKRAPPKNANTPKQLRKIRILNDFSPSNGRGINNINDNRNQNIGTMSRKGLFKK